MEKERRRRKEKAEEEELKRFESKVKMCTYLRSQFLSFLLWFFVCVCVFERARKRERLVCVFSSPPHLAPSAESVREKAERVHFCGKDFRVLRGRLLSTDGPPGRLFFSRILNDKRQN